MLDTSLSHLIPCFFKVNCIRFCYWIIGLKYHPRDLLIYTFDSHEHELNWNPSNILKNLSSLSHSMPSKIWNGWLEPHHPLTSARTKLTHTTLFCHTHARTRAHTICMYILCNMSHTQYVCLYYIICTYILVYLFLSFLFLILNWEERLGGWGPSKAH